MRLSSRAVALTAVFAALYAAGVVLLAPVSFGIYQVRIADALLPLSMIFGIPVAVGSSLGCLVANVYGGLGIIDVVGGAVANLIACALAWHIGRGGVVRRFMGSLAETAVITAIVGGYLSILFGFPIEIGLFGIFIGSFVAINILGFTLEEILNRSSALKG